jgi:aminopeptidase N
MTWRMVRTALVALTLAAGARAAEPSGTAFKSLAYEIALTPDFDQGVVIGTERLRFRSLADGVDTLSFTANPFAVRAVLDGVAVPNAVVGGRRVFHLPRALRRGETATLVMSFAGRPRRDVTFTRDELHTSYFTCEVLVCDNDRPGDRATLDLALTLPVGMDAVAPGRLVSRTPAASGTETWRWREDRAYAPYLFGFAAGRYAREALAGGAGLSVLYRDQPPARVQTLFGATGGMAAFFADKAGVALPEGRYTQVLVASDDAQEDAALSMIGRAYVEEVLKDPQDDWVVAHELAHQWWGNLVTCADWRELWLNEGLTSFMTAAWKEQRWGRPAYDREIALARRGWDAAKAADFDRPLSWSGDYPSLRAKRRIAYSKSVVFLDTLRTEIGEAAFWRGVRAYTRANTGRAVTAKDLQAAFERASGRDLSGLFATWVSGGG